MSGKNLENVVQISDHAAFARGPRSPDALLLLRHCRDDLSGYLSQTAAHALENAENTLLDLANKAGTGSIQGHYFAAIAELRTKRNGIATTIKDIYAATSEGMIAGAGYPQPGSNHPRISEAGLGALERSDIDESFAVNAIAGGIEASYHEELSAINERVSFLLNRKIIANEDNPLGPYVIFSSLAAACEEILSGADIKIIIFKLFESHFCESAQHIYHEINTRLNHGADMTSDSKSGNSGTLGAVKQLAVENRPNAGTNAAEIDAATYSRRIVDELTLLQQGRWQSSGDRNVIVDPSALNCMTTNMVRLIRENASSDRLPEKEAAIMDTVALLFDDIFDNGDISENTKNLLGGLQIPMLKVAMLDKSFFSNKCHPAKRLLNAVVQAMLGLREDGHEENVIRKEVETQIQKIKLGFNTDVSIFGNALTDLQSALRCRDELIDANIKEAKKVVQGRERLKIAESLVESEIEKRLSAQTCPEFIRSFAMKQWKNLLIVAYLKKGQESEAWKNRIKIIEFLIWSIQPKMTSQDKSKLAELLPTLITGIKKGMGLLSMDEDEQTGFLEKLSICHRRAANGETYAGKPAFRPMGLAVSYLPGDGETSATPASTKPTPDIPRQTISSKQIGSMVVEGLNVLSQDGNQKTPQETAPNQLRANIDPFGASSTDPIKEATNDRPEVLKDLRPGAWLEFRDSGAKSVERLSWISVVLGSYLFTSQDGLKSRELSAEEMEVGLHNGQITRTDDPSLALIRSFDTMLDRLQKKIAG